MISINRCEVGKLLSDQYKNKLNFNIPRGPLIERWLTGENYVLQTISSSTPKSLIEVRDGAKTHSTGPIIIDYNKNEIPFEFNTNNEVPQIIVIDGNHRLNECLERGEKIIDAYVSDSICNWS